MCVCVIQLNIQSGESVISPAQWTTHSLKYLSLTLNETQRKEIQRSWNRTEAKKWEKIGIFRNEKCTDDWQFTVGGSKLYYFCILNQFELLSMGWENTRLANCPKTMKMEYAISTTRCSIFNKHPQCLHTYISLNCSLPPLSRTTPYIAATYNRIPASWMWKGNSNCRRGMTDMRE